jgi:hypothetical protein
VRVIWSVELADMATIHLHPKDVAGAIVSLDWANPVESWRWAGPSWTGHAAASSPSGGLATLTVAVSDPAAVAHQWAAILELTATVQGNDAIVNLSEAKQVLRFVAKQSTEAGGITSVGIRATTQRPAATIGGVAFTYEEMT